MPSATAAHGSASQSDIDALEAKVDLARHRGDWDEAGKLNKAYAKATGVSLGPAHAHASSHAGAAYGHHGHGASGGASAVSMVASSAAAAAAATSQLAAAVGSSAGGGAGTGPSLSAAHASDAAAAAFAYTVNGEVALRRPGRRNLQEARKWLLRALDCVDTYPVS